MAEHGVEVKEVRCDDALGLGGEEFPPGGTGAAWCWVDACVVQDLPDRRGGDAMSEADQFALDAAVSHRGLSLVSRTASVLIVARVGGRPVRRCAVQSHLGR